MSKRIQNTVIMHDGKFGADWVNITLGPNLIARVKYQPDGSQRDIAERFVKGWNELDVLTVERDALAAIGPAVREGARKRTNAIETLIIEMLNIREKLEPGMNSEQIAAILVQINKAVRLARAQCGTPMKGDGR